MTNKRMTTEEWLEKSFLDMEESDRYRPDEKELIAAVRQSNMTLKNKMHFFVMSMDLYTERLHSRNLENRLDNFYDDKEVEELVNRIVRLSPKLGSIDIMAGFDELGEHVSIPMPRMNHYPVDKEWSEKVNELDEKIKKVIRMIICDAKKKWKGRYA